MKNKGSRSLLARLLLVFALAAVGLVLVPGVANAVPTLQVSTHADRSNATALEGALLNGNIHVFVPHEAGISKVLFYLDDPNRSRKAYKSETKSPWDLAGTATSQDALPFDTASLADGAHTITAAVTISGSTVVTTSTFTVDNSTSALVISPDSTELALAAGAAPAVRTLQVGSSSGGSGDTVALASDAAWLQVPTAATTGSTFDVTIDPAGLAPGSYTGTITGSAQGFFSDTAIVRLEVVSDLEGLVHSPGANRAGPAELQGAVVVGNLYAFVAPDAGLTRVVFRLDDPDLSHPPIKTESGAPFDFAGTSKTTGLALPYDTTTIPDGQHTISATITKGDRTYTIHATFDVRNEAPRLTLSPAATDLSMEEGDGPTVRALTVGASGGSPGPVALTSDAAWLRPASSVAAGDSTDVVVDPAGLAAGVYVGKVTASADGFAPASASFNLTVTPDREDILVSFAPNRSNPVDLDGAEVAGHMYVFVFPETGITRVVFKIDGSAHRTEKGAPFDLNGSDPAGLALPFDTRTLAEGPHTVSATITKGDQTYTVAAKFTVRNTKLGFSPKTAQISAVQDSFPGEVEVTLAGADPSVTTSDDAAWLTVSPATGAAPRTLLLSANPAALVPDTYTATVTATASTGETVQLPVTFTVESNACRPVACGDIRVDLPYVLDFSENHGHYEDGNGFGTGFTAVQPTSKGSGYLREKLTVTQTPGHLAVQTTAGITTDSVNSLDNALSVGVAAANQVTVVSSALVDIPAGTGNFEQAGIWFGVDEDNYTKLVVQSRSTGTHVELLTEVNGARTAVTRSGVLNIGTSPAVLTLKADPIGRDITGSFTVNGSTSSLGPQAVPPEFFSFDGAGIDPRIGTRSFAGIMASHRNGPAPLTYTFNDFSVTAAQTDVPSSSLKFDRVAIPSGFPTAMTVGPDGKLYVAEIFGTIHRITLAPDKSVVSDEAFTPLGSRLTLGLTIDPASTPDNVILWANHSSPSPDNGEVNSGVVTRIAGQGLGDVTHAITGLPRAKANHGPNNLHFGPDGRLYMAIGGNTGAGAPNEATTEFGDRPEQPLSAAILVADVKSPAFQGDCATPLNTFGIPETCDVRTWATGLRNTYDFVFHSNGEAYGPDNGLGVTGTYPPTPTAPCTGIADSTLHDPGEQPDFLNRFEAGGYYGHPNPYRNECVFHDGSEQGVAADPNFRGHIFDLGPHKSANAIIEYESDAFCGALKGDLLITNYSVGDDISRVSLSDDGLSVLDSESLAGGFSDPLPMTQGPDGTIYVGETGAGRITALVPRNTGCWSTEAPLPVNLLDAGGAALDGKVYVVGGKTGSTAHVSTVHVYDTAADTWSAAADLPGPAVENPAVVAHDGKVYAFGGSTAPFSGAVPNAAVFDPATGTWTALPAMPTARGGAAAQVLDGKIYVLGGMGEDGASVASVEIFDPVTGTWTTGPAMGTRRDNLGAASIGGTLYAFGGRTRDADGTTVAPTLASVEAYDPATGAWTPRTAAPTGRRAMGVAVVNGKAVVLGGEATADGNTFSQNEQYDPTTDTWQTLSPMPTGRHGFAVGVVNGAVHTVGGGIVAGGSFSNVHEVFSLAE
ncbi:MAG: PQQ-dependent sugar dehydrogenase [Actinomycetota bacterium]|nr:PQQ-dependent sugar dehydrogenase [Actinomycetota bacterium]